MYASKYCHSILSFIIAGFDQWPARTKWTLDFFKQRYGDLPLDIEGGKLSIATLIDDSSNTGVHPPELACQTVSPSLDGRK